MAENYQQENLREIVFIAAQRKVTENFPLAGHRVLSNVFRSRIICSREMASKNEKKKKNVFEKDNLVKSY